MSKKNILPIIPIKGNVALPLITKNIEVGKKTTLKAVDFASKESEASVVIVPIKQSSEGEVKVKDFLEFGTITDFSVIKKWENNALTLKLSPKFRVNINKVWKDSENDFWMCEFEEVNTIFDLNEEDKKEIASYITDQAKDNKEWEKYLHVNLENNNDEINYELLLDSIVNDFASGKIVQNPDFILSPSLKNRWAILKNILSSDEDEMIVQPNNVASEAQARANVEHVINKKLKDKMDKQQKEYYLREKMRIIKDELDEEDSENDKNSIEGYKNRLAKEPFPIEVKNKILASIKRIEAMQSGTPEWNTEKNYVDWMMSIPWWEESEDLTDLQFAQDILDKHHYGLKKVKQRIIEYLAVKTKTSSLKAPIITLVGPPGVGKTSLAKSIAEAIGKTFVKVSLGGVKDESEIRGHRKTYVGSMPGRIIQTMKRAKVKNPLFLLDEIDKMASDQRGDPASAMLEVLDPEQNKEFSDHYIEEPYDLSQVMFIATANYAQDIPEALYDRMEIIDLSSYTEIEKMKIAKDYLVDKSVKEHSLSKEELTFTDSALEEIIKYYTREAGVRQLERHINSISRKYIVKLLNKELTNLIVDPKVVNEFLGKRIFDHTEKQNESQVGVVTGLAYTQFGGDILPIEVSLYPGKGNLVLTGKLGDVMKESATIALTYVKSNNEKYGIDSKIFENNDIHIHVPEGAVPKDGPSAGITITTALISALANKPVSKEFGMTGEITLRGNVLPIGGLREKSISAARSGLKTIIIPIKNEKDLDEIPDEVKSILKIIPAEKYEQVFDIIFK
ncbi:class III heat-shock ATP-dependent LonA protease [Entomoplasma ellychniae]|uniref:Lon protease n=1 Tax=Entomoplasma ellychniae TaxID=2114 RepID=A0A8E2QZ11_9MOLU|nr:endopeptidase La [Entomoplasma ellychniae]PPE04480.1 class III heat-shock ATP-dependent LonA protease [Entomoplasma ellychniae]